jgi:putative SOS response-associated peptidase YedK
MDMCYDIKTSYESQLKRAIRLGQTAAIKEIEEKLRPYRDHTFHHVSGYSHPKLLIYTNISPTIPIVSTWGLVPYWVKSEAHLLKFWNSTLNARIETIFEKPSFKYSAKSKRCLIILDGFYEHHHYKGKSYPFHIKSINNKPLYVAGLWSEWLNKSTGEIINTFAIVTTRGNKFMSKIHNNPKLKEPRMPVILEDTNIEYWLNLDNKEIHQFIKPFDEEDLMAYPVKRIRGKEYLGNIKEVSEEFEYSELVF